MSNKRVGAGFQVIAKKVNKSDKNQIFTWDKRTGSFRLYRDKRLSIGMQHKRVNARVVVERFRNLPW